MVIKQSVFFTVPENLQTEIAVYIGDDYSTCVDS